MTDRVWWPLGMPQSPTATRLLCFPHAGGGASAYRSWTRAAPPELEVCPVQLPGREARIREAPFRRVDEAVAALLEVVRPYLDRPYALFGYSMGALLAYELTNALVRSGSPSPVALFAAAAGAPGFAGVDDTDALADSPTDARTDARSGGNPQSHRNLHALPDAAFKEALRDLSGTPDAVLEHEELMELMLPVLRADFELHETYQPGSAQPVPCPLVAFGGDDDPNVSVNELTAWEGFTAGAFRHIVYPGHHFFFETAGDDILAQVAQTLRTETNS